MAEFLTVPCARARPKLPKLSQSFDVLFQRFAAAGCPMSELSPQLLLTTGLALLTAFGYAVATFGMKLASDNPGWMGVTVLLTGFALAAFAEILLLQRFDLARTYIIIIAVESALIFAAALWFGESLSRAQLCGAVMVIVGLSLTLA